MTKLRLPKDCKWASKAVQSKLGIFPSSGLHFSDPRLFGKLKRDLLAHQNRRPPSINLGRLAPHVRLAGLPLNSLTPCFFMTPPPP